MRLACLSAVVMTTLMSFARTRTPDVGGRVVDEEGTPLPFVNVVLLSLPDSAFIEGAITDEQGAFKIVTDKGGLLKISSIGYQTQYLAAPLAGKGETVVRMREDAQLLGEVVVKAMRQD